MSDFYNFISENYIIIIAISLSIFGLLVFISFYNINLESPTVNTKISQVVTVETFDINMDMDKDYFQGNKYSSQ
jgi:hypothetical protein